MKRRQAPDPTEAALQSVEGIQRASADEALLQKIEARIQARQAVRQLQQQRILFLTRRVAAAAAVMLVVNCVVWLSVGIPILRAENVDQFSRLYFTSSFNY